MGYIGQDEDHLESPGTPSCDSLQTSNPMQSSGLRHHAGRSPDKGRVEEVPKGLARHSRLGKIGGLRYLWVFWRRHEGNTGRTSLARWESWINFRIKGRTREG